VKILKRDGRVTGTPGAELLNSALLKLGTPTYLLCTPYKYQQHTLASLGIPWRLRSRRDTPPQQEGFDLPARGLD
jgi:hypothetical protein